MSPPDRSFLLFKPDGVQRGLVAEGVRAVHRAGLTITARRHLRLTEGQVAGVYSQVDPLRRPLTAGILRRCLGGRLRELVEVAGERPCPRLLDIKKELRRRFGSLIYGNVLHTPDTPAEAYHQIRVLRGAAETSTMDFRPVSDRWHGWSAQRIESALDAWWSDVARAGLARPTRWARPVPADLPQVRVAVPAEWVIAFDDIGRFLADLAGVDDPGFAVRATLAALYDRDGVSIAARSPAAARQMARRVRTFGLIASVVPAQRTGARESPVNGRSARPPACR